MLSIDWRAPVAYAHAKSIPPAGFAWEYLRRHEDYDRDFQTLSGTTEPAASRLEAFSRRWGLRFSPAIPKPALTGNRFSGFRAFSRKRFAFPPCSSWM